MPRAQLRALARRTGARVSTAERVWRKKKAELRPKKSAKRGKHSYRYLMGTVRNIMQNRLKGRRRGK